MQIRLGAKITIQNPTEEIVQYCKDNLILDNPDYKQKVRLGLWLGNTPKNLWLYETSGNSYILPFGCLQDVWRIHSYVQDWGISFPEKRKVEYNSSIIPWNYQVPAINALLKSKNGILIMPCGSGKTQTALAVVAKLGLKTLWITHTHDLLVQSMSRAKSAFNIPASCFGTITDGKINVSTHITFSTVQTMQKVVDNGDYLDYWDVVVVDECHKAIGAPTRVMMFYKVLSRLCARYKFGLTATPKRSDGLEKAMFALLGNKVWEVTQEDVESHTVPIKIIPIFTGYAPEIYKITNSDGTINYSKAQSEMIRNEDRLSLVVEKITEVYNEGKSILVLSDRIAHLEDIHKNCGVQRDKIIMLYAKGKKQDRVDALRKMQNGEAQVLLATYQLAKEGLDIPRLDAVFLAMPKKDYATVIQSCGRCSRKFENKAAGYVYDFVDDFGMYFRMYKNRRTYYKKAGYEIY